MSQPDAFKKLGMAEISRLSDRMGKLMEAQMKDMNSPGYNERLQKEQESFGCHAIAFSLKPGGDDRQRVVRPQRRQQRLRQADRRRRGRRIVASWVPA